MDAPTDATPSASISESTAASRGGPRTEHGKQRSRANATKHGLTASTLADEVLRRQRVAELTKQFERELRPKNALERALVAEMARHYAMMEVGEKAEGAILRHGAQMLSPTALLAAADILQAEDAVLCAAATTDALDKLCRYRRSHERGFYAALSSLQNLRNATASLFPKEMTSNFDTEEKCHAYLVEFRTRNLQLCQDCHSEKRAYWAASTNCFVCPGCDRQTGLRSGTVMECSPLPLKVWFTAIEAVIAKPTITVADLAEEIGITRRGTVRNILQRIQEAIGSDDAHNRLVSLAQRSK